ncbi:MULTISPECIES: N-acetylmuramoyl-L-alanine amidase [unclassified Clostridium]|uniref:N-acetylmuramoyl-L-alanine amidase n=1 Tax=unclassified Clostridium TaxID=2614128 RepID=UPI00290EA5F8|nr:N-acetylmuramoyl-L-alanine amidase [Clostridium sp.]MDU5106545.1 N-acetylmuramoyl-L-alanine amidase [Clostridium sp.]
MKIAVRGGHNFQATGASALIDETTEDRKVKDSLIKYLKLLGNEVLDVTPGPCDANTDLAYGVNKANEWGADLFVSDHFNKAFNSYNGALGTEVWIYSKTDNIKLDEEVGTRVVNTLSELGFKNRGVKESKELYELRATKMASIIVEICFVEATEDVALYKKLGADKIGQVIAEAISNVKINNSNNEIKERKYDMKNLVCYCNQVDKRAAEYLADYLQCPCIDATLPFNYKGVAENIIAVGGNATPVGFSGYTTKYIAGPNRYETVKEVLKFIGK